MIRSALIAALGLAFTGASQAAVTEFVLYKQPDFKGPAQTVKGEVNILTNGFAGQAESLQVRGGYWEACTGDRFSGTCHVYEPGDYARLGEMSGKITSVRFLGVNAPAARRDEPRREARNDRGRYRHGSIDLYGREGFNGRTLHLDENVTDLYTHRFDGQASSLIVQSGTWELCSRENFEGTCRTFEPGEYPRLAGLDNRVTSVRQIH